MASFISILVKETVHFFLTFLLHTLPLSDDDYSLLIDLLIFPAAIIALTLALSYALMPDHSQMPLLPGVLLTAMFILILFLVVVQKVTFSRSCSFFNYVHVLKFTLAFLPVSMFAIGTMPSITPLIIIIVALLMTILVCNACVAEDEEWCCFITHLFYWLVVFHLCGSFLLAAGKGIYPDYCSKEYMMKKAKFWYNLVFWIF